MTLRLALVTGGARRIGAAIVQRLQADGYTVVAHAHSSAVPHRYTADLRCVQQAKHLWQNIIDDFGYPPQLLVCNAGMFEQDVAPHSNDELWHQHMQLHARVPTVLTELLAHHAPAHANAVWIVDQRVLRPNPRFFSYTASKMLAASLVTLLAQSLAPAVRVNAVAPGPTLPSYRQSADSFAAQYRAVPMQQPSPPTAIADAVLFLAQSHSITGHILPVDGGQHVGWQTMDAMVEE